jgi:hypothetical protein
MDARSVAENVNNRSSERFSDTLIHRRGGAVV